ncbi:MAG TPA: O-methyltransferase [Herpetosiphonaceae bacterium]
MADIDALRAYGRQLFAPEDDALRWIQAEADRHELRRISLDADEARLLQLLVLAAGAAKVVEFGTLAGYSGTWIARALPPGGRLWTLEVSSKHARIARASFEHAGVADRVTVVEGAILDSLPKLSREAPFDFIFMDANPESYVDYLAWAAGALRPGGALVAHNAFASGNVTAPVDDRSRGMAAFQAELARRPDFAAGLVPFGEGMVFAVKR